MADRLLINEIFHSIQGESTWSGRPCTFVRLTGCPLRCVWCDTEYAFHGGERQTLDEIVDAVRSIGTSLVQITGGEPLAHPNAYLLTERLLDEGFTVLVETSGAFDVAPLDRRAHRIMDLKCPGSGESDKNLWENLPQLKPNDEVKFVLGSRRDYEWAKEQLDRWDLVSRHTVLFSSVWGQLDSRELAEWVLQDGLQVRLQVQLHKILWSNEVRGV